MVWNRNFAKLWEDLEHKKKGVLTQLSLQLSNGDDKIRSPLKTPAKKAIFKLRNEMQLLKHCYLWLKYFRVSHRSVWYCFWWKTCCYNLGRIYNQSGTQGWSQCSQCGPNGCRVELRLETKSPYQPKTSVFCQTSTKIQEQCFYICLQNL